MSFLVVGLGHSGTKYLATQLGKAYGWEVCHEPDTYIAADIVNKRFRYRYTYGEVNSWLLGSARRIKVDRRGVLLRDPWAILHSIMRRQDMSEEYASMYVREGIEIINGLVDDGWMVIRLMDIVYDRRILGRVAQSLGIDTLDLSLVDSMVLNHHDGMEREIRVTSEMDQEFSRYNDRHGLWTPDQECDVIKGRGH